jgi:hypothetical protein
LPGLPIANGPQDSEEGSERRVAVLGMFPVPSLSGNALMGNMVKQSSEHENGPLDAAAHEILVDVLDTKHPKCLAASSRKGFARTATRV